MKFTRAIKQNSGTRLIPLPPGVFRDYDAISLEYHLRKDSHDLFIDASRLNDGDNPNTVRPIYKIATSRMIPLPAKTWFTERKVDDIFHDVFVVIIEVEFIRNDTTCRLKVRPATTVETTKYYDTPQGRVRNGN